MNAEWYVKRIWPSSSCFGPVKLYWPGQGERTKFIVTSHPSSSRTEGEGDSMAEAWQNALMRMAAKYPESASA